MKKKVLIISYSYPPSNAPAARRPYALAKYLDKDKFDVTVITCGNGDSSLGFDTHFDPALEGVKLIKINSLLPRSVSKLRTKDINKGKSLINMIKSGLTKTASAMIVPDRAIFWYPKVRQYLSKHPDIVKDVDIVYSTSPTFSNHLIGLYVKKKNPSVNWLGEIRDFHYIERYAGRKGWQARVDSLLEKKIIRRCDVISLISFAMRDLYIRHYPQYSEKMHVIYNGFDFDEFNALPTEEVRTKRLTIFYAGSFYRGLRSPDPLFQILDHLIHKGQITPEQIEVRIAGNFDKELLETAKTYKSFASVNLMGNIPRTEVLKQLVSVDLLWLIVGNKTTHYTGVPIKFFEYLGARRPIISFAPQQSEPTRIIKEHQLGWSFNTTAFDVITESVKFLEILEFYRNGKLMNFVEYKYLSEFDRVKQAEAFAELFVKNKK